MDVFLSVIWYVPSTLMTLWTLFAIGAALLTPIGSDVPFLASQHVLLLIRNHENCRLWVRFTFRESLFVLVVGLFPLLSLIVLAFHLYMLAVYLHCIAEDKQRKGKR